MKNERNNTPATLQNVRETIESGKYNIDVQYCHPERVSTEQLQIAENTAEKGLTEVTDKEILDTIAELGEDANICNVLTTIADRYDDATGHETITPVVNVR